MDGKIAIASAWNCGETDFVVLSGAKDPACGQKPFGGRRPERAKAI